MLLDPGMNLTLRPMQYPEFYEMYRDAIKNTWTVEEVDFSSDVQDLKNKLTPAEQHLIRRLVAFFCHWRFHRGKQSCFELISAH